MFVELLLQQNVVTEVLVLLMNLVAVVQIVKQNQVLRVGWLVHLLRHGMEVHGYHQVREVYVWQVVHPKSVRIHVILVMEIVIMIVLLCVHEKYQLMQQRIMIQHQVWIQSGIFQRIYRFHVRGNVLVDII